MKQSEENKFVEQIAKTLRKAKLKNVLDVHVVEGRNKKWITMRLATGDWYDLTLS